VDVSSVAGSGIALANFYNTADNAGHVLICNLAQNNGTFKVWRLDLPSGTPQLYIDWSANTSLLIGRKLSVQGNIDGNAIITAPILDATSRFARWTVTGGVLQKHIPDLVTISGYAWSNNHCDVVQTSDSDMGSDYFTIGYWGANAGSNRLARINGQNNVVRDMLETNLSQNYTANAVDYTEFNNGKYAAYTFANGFDWGQADQIWLIDAKEALDGNPVTKVVWEETSGKYGSWSSNINIQNTNGTSDVAFRISDDGFFLYMYFMFTNGYIVCVQFDCIDM
jgi:hypothetical protein